MARLLVVVGGDDNDVVALADSIVEGARSVRFAEADLVRLGAGGEGRIARVRTLADVDALTGYDAIVVGGPAGDDGGLSRLLLELAGLGSRGALANKLGSVFPAADPATTGTEHPLWPLLAPMARYGMILVPPGYFGPTGEPEDLHAAARRLGKRLIDIAGWIVHARSHHHH